MFKSFFLDTKWMFWSILGSVLILAVTWGQVQVNVYMNEWFGDFYNIIQQALSEPNSVDLDTFLMKCFEYMRIAGVYVVIAVVLGFFINHYVFRWRMAMNDYYMSHWEKLRHIEGAAQRIQEDTMRFAKIVEGLGVAFLRSVMTLIAFLPLLWELSKHVTELPYIGAVDHALVYIAILSALFGTAILALVGIKLPGLEFNNQKVEAAYRKELVLGEDYAERADPLTVKELFTGVRKNYFTLYLHYLYFDIARYSYLQVTVLLPYFIMAPTIVAGVITLGLLNQILRAFNNVEGSFQFLVNSWSTIVELMSIYKRLKAFEKNIHASPAAEHGTR
ncbi:peptide antibiotic transporter SbmA [Marinomonas agarivorans]|nr:peptide antibiotic transporter SbmA [Marinomonas agarivorans]